MSVAKWILVALVITCFSHAGFCATKDKYASFAGNPVSNASEKTFQELQTELNKEKCKRKVVSRYEVVEGLHGLNAEDISLTLLDYSYHYLNDSGKRQPFVKVQCRVDISKFEKKAEMLREQLKSSGRQAPVKIELPDTERLILGVLDDVKDEFITLVSVPNTVKPIVKFAELRKNKPEYMILSLEPSENCRQMCDQRYALNTAVMGFAEKSKTYDKILEVETYRLVDKYDDLSARQGYIDKSSVSWSDWINNEYRELIITTDRKSLGAKEESKTGFKNKKDIYGWVNARELVLVEQIVDGKSIMSRKGEHATTLREVTLKDGELYELNGQVAGGMITATGGKINSYLQSPDKRHVAYSVIVGYTDDAGEYEKDEKRPQVPVFNIIVMDLRLKKQLTEIKPQYNESFISVKRWSSNEELELDGGTEFSVDSYYFYNVVSNEIRKGNLGDLKEMN